MASKRPAESDAEGAGPPKKKAVTSLQPLNLGAIYSLEELDLKVLQFQNKKLAERIEQRKRYEDELHKRIEQLENRQRTDDTVLMIVNRYWNQLDEDVRVLLQRFDAETADDEAENQNDSIETISFLTLLSTWDKQELEQRLGQRVEFSKRAIGKLLKAFDRLLQRNELLNKAVQEKVDREEEDTINIKTESEIKQEPLEPNFDVKLESDVKTEVTKEDDKEEKSEIKKEPSAESDNTNAKLEEPPIQHGSGKSPPPVIKQEIKEEPQNAGEVKEEVKVPKPQSPVLISTVKNELAELQQENRRLHSMVTELHQRHHEHTLKVVELQDKLTAAETEIAELTNKIDDLEYNYEKAEQRAEKLDRHLAEAQQKLNYYEDKNVIQLEGGKSITGVSRHRFEEILADLEEQRELATNRMVELEKLNKEHQEALKQIEQLKLDLQHIPENVIVETTEYKCLQSQFSVLYNECLTIRTQLDEARNLLSANKNTHLRQIEQMECSELENQKKLRTEMIQLEDALAQVRKEYEMLRIEFEQTLAAHEQTGPINHEMRNLIQSLQKHNQQLKGEAQRNRRRLKEAQLEIKKLKQEECSETKEAGSGEPAASVQPVFTPASQTAGISTATSTPKSEAQESTVTLRDDEKDEIDFAREKGKSDQDIIKDLKAQLKPSWASSFRKSQDSQKELKLLLDMYKSAPKEQRDKVQLMASEKRSKQEIEDLKGQIRKMQENERKEKRKLAEEDALRKIKRMEEQISELQKNLSIQKQREEALLNEMDVTGQAFEDMQEQNTRLLQQLREKDDANFKLMSERIKANQIQKLLREEKEVQADQVQAIHQQVQAQNLVVRKLEEKERILQNNIATIEKELSLTKQAMEMHKRKALESSQTAADLKLHLDKYQAQLREAQVAVAEKTGAIEQEAYKYKRMQEEIAKLQRKLERQKKIEMAGAADEVLLAEIQEYKDQLTCPSCKVNRKDAVLTKCFHLFCLECLKTRYETRQRKCPKCNAGFGANDYHRLYLT
ncbi:hypothetical protein CHS0354_031601 [Potamilus streckersoni]|uniref:E3 ubiquitin protein ligase n=1 Tax=Potamilus streckersoni TaxID=2493646 RepID=A0AAE0VVH3_9BIVA|nr:hypothetical protein CHS0354_031601 [Potamilus streckersoni]